MSKDASEQRTVLADTVRVLTPVDLLWLRTAVEQELLRRGFKSTSPIQTRET